MPHHGVLMQKFLIVKALWEHLLFRCRAYYRALVGKGELLFLYQLARLCQKSGFAHKAHIEKQNARIHVIRVNEVFAVMVARGGVFHLGYVNIVKQMNVAVEHNVSIEIEKLVRDKIYSVGKKTDERVGGAICVLVRTAVKLLAVKIADVNERHLALGIIFLYHASQKRDLGLRYGKIIRAMALLALLVLIFRSEFKILFGFGTRVLKKLFVK